MERDKKEGQGWNKKSKNTS